MWINQQLSVARTGERVWLLKSSRRELLCGKGTISSVPWLWWWLFEYIVCTRMIKSHRNIYPPNKKMHIKTAYKNMHVKSNKVSTWVNTDASFLLLIAYYSHVKLPLGEAGWRAQWELHTVTISWVKLYKNKVALLYSRMRKLPINWYAKSSKMNS